MYNRHILCYICNVLSIGFATNLIKKNWYCSRHFKEVSVKADSWLEGQYEKQWSGESWYQELKGTSLYNIQKVFGKVKLL